MNCYHCNQSTHLISNCDQLHYYPDKDKVIKTWLYTTDLQRDSAISRTKVRKRNSLK